MNPASSIWNWNTPADDLPAILVVSVCVFVVLGLSELFKRWGFSKESTRKTAHIGAGLLALPFPWLFKSIWPILLLCGSFLLIMVVSKALKMFDGVHGVERKSLGAFVFPAMIVLIFALAKEPLHYTIPIAVLSLSDALAALIGKKYGRHQFHTLGETRSMEGSTAFFIPTFLLVHLPLLLLSDTGKLACVLMALGCAILVTAFEMISVKGLDNVFIPFGTWYVLDNYASYLPEELSYRIGFMFFSSVFFLLFAYYHIFTRTGAVGGFLVIYALFSMGWDGFFLPALSLFGPLLSIVLIIRGITKKTPEPMGVSHTFQSTIVAILVLFAFDNTKLEWLLFPFLTACSAGTGIVVLRLEKHIQKYKYTAVFLTTVVAHVMAYLLNTHHIKSPTQLVVSWVCTIMCIGLYQVFERYKAIFLCPECGSETLERRHCGKDTESQTGWPFFTDARIGLVVVFVGTLICVGCTLYLLPRDVV